jgi:transcription elongation factor GreA
LEDRVAVLETLLKSASIVSHKDTDIVSMGSIAVIQKKGEKESFRVEIVGTEEADLGKGKLSNKSPLGQAVMGKRKGDTAVYKKPNGEDAVYTIVDVQ